jgi:hypothetical protein
MNLISKSMSTLSEQGSIEFNFSKERGWAFRAGEELTSLIGTPNREFFDSFSRLEQDRYAILTGLNRQRRIGRFAVDVKIQSVIPLSHRKFYQESKHNKLFGGLMRDFAPLEPEIAHSQYLQSLLLEDLAFLNAQVHKGEIWEAIVHQIRVIPQASEAALPAPEGRHRDGHEYLVMHLIERHNITGGESYLYEGDDESEPLFVKTLTNPLDAIFVHDARLTHDVSPIRAEAPIHPAWRSMLLIDFNLRPCVEVFHE